MGCTVDSGRYSAPMPWIGLYITAASVACSIAIVVDIFLGMKHKRLWLPCKWFSLNATSLTLLAIATKLPVDLSTPMPTAQEQFAKLSGTSLLCIAVGHFMPSIGAMEDSQVILNVVPVVILVITVIVNICVQIGTGVIHAFIPEHIITLCFMLMILLISCSSAVAIPAMKGLLKQQFELNCQKIKHERELSECAMSTVDNLKKDIKKYLTMALTSNPQHVLSRSCLGHAAGCVCLLQAVVLIEAFIRMLKGVAVSVCTNQSSSDYKWSIPFIVFSQTFTVVVGTLARAFRFRFEESEDSSSAGIRESQEHQGHQSAERKEQTVRKRQNIFGLERYWTQKFVEWKERPLLIFHIRNRCSQRLIYDSKNLFFEVMRWVHVGVVLLSKFANRRSEYDHISSRPEGLGNFQVMSKLLLWEIMIIQNIEKIWWKIVQNIDKIFSMIFEKRDMLERKFLQAIGKMFPPVASVVRKYEEFRTEKARQTAAKKELRPFVLHMENEGRLVDWIMRSYDLNVERKLQKGSCNPLQNLTKLLMKSSEHYPSLTDGALSNTTNLIQEHPNCWALPLVTITSIALALPYPGGEQIKKLLQDGVSEGLKYVRYVDKSLDSQGQLAKVREAADIVWLGVVLYNRWLDMDLATFSTERGGPKNVIEQLVIKGRIYEAEVEIPVCDRGDLESGFCWPPRALALYSMANICRCVLNTHTSFNTKNTKDLFLQLHIVISDMLGACLVNLPRALYMHCYNSSLEAKEDKIMDAAYILGGAKKILEMIPRDGIAVNQSKHFEHWRSFMPDWSELPSISPPNASNIAV